MGSIIPHESWRGQMARGTYDAGTGRPQGLRSDCTGFPPVDCVPVPWPGWNTSAWHEEATRPELAGTEHYWLGSLAVGMRDASGQLYKRNRYYDPAKGQFTQPDPIGLAGGVNVYGFAAGDPVTYDDPYGLNPCLKLGKAAAFAAVAAGSDLAFPVGDIVGVACLATAVVATVALAATAADAVDVDIGTRREPPQVLYHRAAGPVETQQVVESGEVWGAPCGISSRPTFQR